MSEKSSGGLKYVTDFEFPADQGFTGSAGKQSVKGYMRGGHVKGKGRNKPNKTPKRAKGTTAAAKGGHIHDEMKREGGKMGYAYGGRVHVSDTSGEFKMKKGKMDSMDHGVQPARRGKNARNEQQREAGGTGRLKPGYAGGGLARAAAKGVKKIKQYEAGKGRVTDKAAERRKASKKGMPKNVKAKGGKVGYGEGGYYGKPGDKYPDSKARQKMPAGVKARGGVVGKRGAARSR